MSLDDIKDVSFSGFEVDEVCDELLALYSKITGRTLAQADPVRLFLLTIAAVIVQQNCAIDQAAKMNLLKYASGDYLDQLGALTDTPRIPAARATTTLTFTLSAVQPSTVTVPAGTRVTTSDKSVFFATSEDLLITPGELTGTVKATCTETGLAGNGLFAGVLTTLVDPVAFVDSVTNTVTGGGADVEDDESYRERIHEAPERFSTAGPTGAYEYWAKTAAADIVDVYVDSPTPGTVKIVPLLTGGAIPEKETLDAVKETVSAEKRRPLTDNVVVEAPTQVSYGIDVTYNVDLGNQSQAVALQAAVKAAVEDYKSWQNSALGRDIDPSRLVAFMANAGATKVQVTSPQQTTVDADKVAHCTSLNVTFGGVSSD